MAGKTYDPKCLDLAEHFLQDESSLYSGDNCDELAIDIQAAIESFIVHKLRNYEPPDPPGFEGGFAENH